MSSLIFSFGRAGWSTPKESQWLWRARYGLAQRPLGGGRGYAVALEIPLERQERFLVHLVAHPGETIGDRTRQERKEQDRGKPGSSQPRGLMMIEREARVPLQRPDDQVVKDV